MNIDGSGKTYHISKLHSKLKKNKLSVIRTREPGGSPNSETIRKIILNKKNLNKYTETFLYLASRSEHLEKKIFPSLKKGKIVICDRFLDSTLAYQGAGFGVNEKAILTMHRLVNRKLTPDLTILLKLKEKTLLLLTKVLLNLLQTILL